MTQPPKSSGRSMAAAAVTRDLLAIVGMCLFVYGAATIYEPLGYLIAGVALISISIRWAARTE